MKKLNLIVSIFAAIIFCFSGTEISAQRNNVPENFAGNERGARPNLLSELELSSQQIREIRRLNQENRFSIRSAQQRFREATRNLDQAIYAVDINEIDVQSLTKELHDAHIELIKVRSAGELAIRRVLTAQQLEKFRQIRRAFSENDQIRPNQRPRRLRGLQNRRLNNRPRRND